MRTLNSKHHARIVGESVLRFLKCVCVCCLGVVHAPVQSTCRTLPPFPRAPVFSVGSLRVAIPSCKLSFPPRMRWQNSTASLVLPRPSELIRTQDEDGGVPPPCSSSSHFPMLDEAVGPSMARILSGDRSRGAVMLLPLS